MNCKKCGLSIAERPYEILPTLPDSPMGAPIHAKIVCKCGEVRQLLTGLPMIKITHRTDSIPVCWEQYPRQSIDESIQEVLRDA